MWHEKERSCGAAACMHVGGKTRQTWGPIVDSVSAAFLLNLGKQLEVSNAPRNDCFADRFQKEISW
jgi:hypothetical protein